MTAELKTNKAKKGGRQKDKRVDWNNKSYNTTYRFVPEMALWKEFDNDGNTIREAVETDRNAEFIQMKLVDRQHQVRLYGDHADIFKDKRWQWVANGDWLDEAGNK